ncbi:MAG: DUF7544 domain-containing protein [Planctomycetota bacterium]|jgi:hypothetical protein
MNAQDVATVSVIDPIGKAIDRVKDVLFNPFDLGKWFVIGFCAWLITLPHTLGGGSSAGNRGMTPDQVKAWFIEHFLLILSIGLGFFFVGLVIAVLFVWLSSRGRFMFLHCVAENKAEVKVPWSKFRNQGDSLFVFRLVVGTIGLVCMIVLVGMIITAVVLLVRNSVLARGALIGGIVVITLIAILVGIVFALINKFTKDFVLPIMYLRRCRCMDAWGEFWHLLGANKWRFSLYILFQVAIAICVGVIKFMIIIFVCCLACCILVPSLIPILGLVPRLLFFYVLTVALLPILVFTRSYSLYYLAQYGGQYDVFVPVANIQEPPAAEPADEEPVNEPPEPVQ